MNTSKRIALIGSNTFLGKELKQLSKLGHHVIEHPDPIPWSEPFKAYQIIGKGRPHVLLSCYSATDDVGANYGAIAKVLVEVSRKINAIVAVFTDDSLFTNKTILIDENTPVDKTTPLAYYEQIISRAKHPLILRTGRLFGSNAGYFSNLLKRIVYDKGPIKVNQEFSVLSTASLADVVAKAVSYEMIGTFNIANRGVLTEQHLYMLLLQQLAKYKMKEPEVVIDGDTQDYKAFDISKWESLSMTTMPEWQTLTEESIKNCVNSFYANQH